jgi:aerobic carbon-monoxide dehydrogenase medium subunit
LYETALEPGELVVAVSFPKPQRAAYGKLRQPASRFALVGVFVSQGANGVRVAVTGAGSSVFRQKAMEDALAKNFAPESLDQVAVPEDNLNGDIHGSATYRAAMIKLMAGKAVAAAAARAGENK